MPFGIPKNDFRGLVDMMDNKKKRKFNTGELVKYDNKPERFEVISWFYEASFDQGDFYEHTHYTIRGIKTGEIFDFVSPNDLDEEQSESPKLVDPFPKKPLVSKKKEEEKKPLTKIEIDELLDQYNDYNQVGALLEHLGFGDDDYKIKSKEIITLLQDSVK